LRLARIGPHERKACIIADSSAKANVHQIQAEGDFGKLFVLRDLRITESRLVHTYW
jgi:predicted dinucleotide-utilizing enzyme